MIGVVAHEVLLEAVALLSVWLSNIIDLETDVVVVGGGVASMVTSFFETMQQQICKVCVNSRAHKIPLVPARHGADLGVVGSAALCTQARGFTIEDVNPRNAPV